MTTFGVSGKYLFACTGQNGIFRSTDYGQSWTAPDAGLTSPTTVVSFAATDSLIFAGTYGGGVWSSTDHGSTWSSAWSGQTEGDVYALAIGARERGEHLLFAAAARGTSYGLYRSINDGNTWANVTNQIASSCTSSTCWVQTLGLSGSNLFAGTGTGGIFRSTNDGDEWTAANAGLPSIRTNILFANGGNLYAVAWGDSGGVFMSANNGESWTNISGDLSNRDVTTLLAYGTNLFVGTWGNGISLSTDNGSTWTEVNKGYSDRKLASALMIHGPYLFAGFIRFGSIPGGVWRRPLTEMITGIQTSGADIPKKFSLSQNYPNPFNPGTRIAFSIPIRSFVTLRVFDILGRQISILASEELSPGNYEREWNANEFPTGLYFCRFQAGTYSGIKKLLLLR